MPLNDFSARLPFHAGDVSLSTTGSEVAFATHSGAYIASLNTLVECASAAKGGGTASQSASTTEVAWSVWGGDGDSSTGSNKPSGSMNNVDRVAFSPHYSCRHQLAVASGSTVALVDASRASRAESFGEPDVSRSEQPYTELVAHLRPITALAWSPHAPTLLATCAEDCRFHLWDVRHRTPAQAFLAPASWTSAVRWAVFEENMLATGHNDMLCTWDVRNASQHMHVVATGQSQVVDIDWSLHDRQRLLSVSATAGEKSCAGAIKVWDLSSAERHHVSIDVNGGLPSAARFLPFGPAVLVAVEQQVGVFWLRGWRRPQLLTTFDMHQEAVNFVDFIRPAAQDSATLEWGSGSSNEKNPWYFVSWSNADRILSVQRYSLPTELMATVEPARTGSATMGQHTPAPPSPVSTSSTRHAHAEERCLGGLATQAGRLRRLPYRIEVASYRQALPREEYQLSIELLTTNDISLQITVGIDPVVAALDFPNPQRVSSAHSAAAPSVEQCLSEPGVVRKRGICVAIRWGGPWAGTDGPLAPGVIEETFGTLSLDDLLGHGDSLCSCVEALVEMLHRRDSLPRLGGFTPPLTPNDSVHLTRERSVRSPVRDGVGNVPFPRSCGVCWGPGGDLLRYNSLPLTRVPFPRKWSYTDFQRILKLHREKDQKQIIADDGDDISEAARRLLVDPEVFWVTSRTFYGLVEDHWWTVAAKAFHINPTPTCPPAEICTRNSQEMLRFGRRDLAEVWQKLAFVVSTNQNWHSFPFARQLVEKIVTQLFEAQETQMLAIVGVVLLQSAVNVLPKVQQASKKQPKDRPPSVNAPSRPPEVFPQKHFDPPSRYGLGSKTWSPSRSGLNLGLQARKLRNSRVSEESIKEEPNSEYCPGVFVPLPQQSPHSGNVAGGTGWHASPILVPSTQPQILEPPPPPRVSMGVEPAREPGDGLLPRDSRAVACLLHSTHAHCELFHRIGELHMSRALNKLLYHYRGYHTLPQLGECGLFGKVRQLSATDTEWHHGDSQEAIANGLPLCCVCSVVVRTLFTQCLACGHKAHMSCHKRWFQQNPGQSCPAPGCECLCRGPPIDERAPLSDDSSTPRGAWIAAVPRRRMRTARQKGRARQLSEDFSQEAPVGGSAASEGAGLRRSSSEEDPFPLASDFAAAEPDAEFDRHVRKEKWHLRQRQERGPAKKTERRGSGTQVQSGKHWHQEGRPRPDSFHES